MKENKYDDNVFFEKYSQMDRSKKGLDGAGEWHVLKQMLPDFRGKRILDLGCGFGWHCEYAIENGAASAVGIDISEKMLAEAHAQRSSEAISYICLPIEDIDFPPSSCLLYTSAFSLKNEISLHGFPYISRPRKPASSQRLLPRKLPP